MRRIIQMAVAAMLIAASTGAQAQPAVGFSGPGPLSAAAPDVWSLQASANEIGLPAGVISKELDRVAAQVALASAPLGQTESGSRPTERSWIGRHPVIFGALVGAGAGAIVGGIVSPEKTDIERSVLVSWGIGGGAGVGAGVGAVIGLVRR